MPSIGQTWVLASIGAVVERALDIMLLARNQLACDSIYHNRPLDKLLIDFNYQSTKRQPINYSIKAYVRHLLK
jgi:hypothetical protein